MKEVCGISLCYLLIPPSSLPCDQKDRQVANDLAMPRGKQLTDLEIGHIIAFKKLQMSKSRIAQELKRSEKIVRTYLQQASRKQPKKRTGRPSKLKIRDVRRIFRLATVSQLSSKKIAARLEEKANEDNQSSTFTLHYTTVLKVLRASKFAKYIKRKKSPRLTTKHKQLRVEFAARHLNKLDEFKLTIYRGEMKFNLDGPDGCQYYWHDLWNEREKYSCNVAGGGSVMRAPKVSKIRQTLKQYLVPAIEELKRQSGRSLAHFQQDNASVHSSGESMKFIKNLDAETVKWPAKIPDLNPIENVWGVLTRSVYANGRQFSTRTELKCELDQKYLGGKKLKCVYTFS
uniref:Protein T04A11.11 putative n=1 Tax=Albugo laibachii Nc14 TaxID=890382 RepID=F0WQZ4_9STRA|nr:protein T04A11.11 putative [Albugo laibachii Nc14]|eukprot:CCA23754.1 protein T04A11.11 putative [Albugo laibachii Nc14]